MDILVENKKNVHFEEFGLHDLILELGFILNLLIIILFGS